MKCMNCENNEATFHKIRNINGKVTEKHLCEVCRQQLGEEIPKINFQKEINNFFDDDFFAGELIFDNDLLKPNLFLENNKKDNDNKNLKRYEKNTEIYEKIAKLKQEQKLAVELENYEEAQKLKLEIEKLSEGVQK